MVTDFNSSTNSDSLSTQPDFIITPNECAYKKGLYQQHYDECLRRGLKHETIASLVNSGVLYSFTIAQGSKWKALPGFQVLIGGQSVGDVLVMQFSETFSQIKPDKELYQHSKRLKYLSASGVKSQAWYPQGFGDENKLKVITEGFFDAAIGTYLGGIPTAALAGVSHYQKAIRSDLKAVILFDSDAVSNPSVIGALYVAGKYSNNKIQLIPPIPGQPKAGLEEYFKAGYTVEDYKKLISDAMPPLRFLYHVINSGLPEDERKLYVVRQVCKLAIRHEKYDDAIALMHDACKKAKLPAEVKARIKSMMDADVKLQQRIKAKQQKERELNKPVLKKDSDLYREAEALLDSGKFFEKVDELITKSGIVDIHEHIRLDLIGSSGVVSKQFKRYVNPKYRGQTGGGKSIAQDKKAELMPPENIVFGDTVSPAYLKRAGDSLIGCQVVCDELTTLMANPDIIGLLKTLMSKGKVVSRMTEPSESGKHEIVEYVVNGPVSFSMCATEQTQVDVLGTHEDELMNRCLEISMPVGEDYNRKANRSAFKQKEPKSLEELDKHSVEVIREAIRIAMSRPTPTMREELEECLLDNVELSQALSRFMANFRILLENCSALLGQAEIGIDAYRVVYPLLNVIIQNKSTASNSTNLDHLNKLYKHLTKAQPSNAFMAFNFEDISEATQCGERTARERLKALKQAGWIEATESNSKASRYCFTKSGKAALSDGIVLTEILPNPDKLAAAWQHLCKVTPNSGTLESLTTQGLQDTSIITYADLGNAIAKDETLTTQGLEGNNKVNLANENKGCPTNFRSRLLDEQEDGNKKHTHPSTEIAKLEEKTGSTPYTANVPSLAMPLPRSAKHCQGLPSSEQEQQMLPSADIVRTTDRKGTLIQAGDTVAYINPTTQERVLESVIAIMKSKSGNNAEDKLLLGDANKRESTFMVDVRNVYKTL